MSVPQAESRGRVALLVGILVLVGLGVGLAVAAPWDSTAHGQRSIGTPLTFKTQPKPAPSHRHVIGAPTPSTLTQDQINQVVAAHNAWRQKYGVTQMVVWDDTVAAVAQDWANQIAASGNFDHRPDGTYGENIFAWWASDPNATITPQFVVDKWGSEDADYDKNTLTCADGKVCGHFTQVVWSTTTKVGCGKSTSPSDPGQVYWVCNYDPAGNYGGVNPFTGQPTG